MTMLDDAYGVPNTGVALAGIIIFQPDPVAVLVARSLANTSINASADGNQSLWAANTAIATVLDNNWRFLPEPFQVIRPQYIAEQPVFIRDENLPRHPAGLAALFIRDENPAKYAVATPQPVIRDENPPRYPVSPVSCYLVKYWLFGGTADNSRATIATVTTYYLRGWDSSGQFVFWSSVGLPDVTPVTTEPAVSGALGNVCVVGIVTT